ncbi:MAG: HAD family hydrolase [Patescibacteria group bacterium]
MKYSCILFDFDGTLAHSDDALFATINDTLKTHGHGPINKEVFNGYIGKKMRSLYKQYANGDDEKATEMRRTHVEVQKKHLHKYYLYPHVKEVLDILKSKNIILGVVTTANKIKMNELIQVMNIRHYFDVFVTAEDVTNVKPHKEPFEKALSTLGKKPEETLMVGDTDADVEGAKASGIDVVGVTYSTVGQAIKNHNPTYTIDSFDELLKIIGV